MTLTGRPPRRMQNGTGRRPFRGAVRCRFCMGYKGRFPGPGWRFPVKRIRLTRVFGMYPQPILRPRVQVRFHYWSWLRNRHARGFSTSTKAATASRAAAPNAAIAPREMRGGVGSAGELPGDAPDVDDASMERHGMAFGSTLGLPRREMRGRWPPGHDATSRHLGGTTDAARRLSRHYRRAISCDLPGPGLTLRGRSDQPGNWTDLSKATKVARSVGSVAACTATSRNPNM